MTDLLRPPPGPPRDYRFPAVARTILPNGLRVAVAPMPRLPLVTVFALVDAGATRDPIALPGLASLTARALAEGTAHFDGTALTERFERLGSGLDTGSDWDNAMVHLTVTPARLDAAMTLLGDVLTTPAFAEGDVERLKAERLADLLQRQVEPRGLANDRFAEFLYVPASRYRAPEDGNTHSVPQLRREAVADFHRTHYVPGTTTLIFAGDITPEQAVAVSERVFGGWRGTTPPATAVDDRAAFSTPHVRIVHKADAPQSELRVGHRGVPRLHPDYFPIVVMNALLGGLFSSRINLNLRERNAFTYGAHSAFDWRRSAGPFVVSTAVKTEVTDAATREILHEILRMREETVGAEELSLATAYLDGVFPIRYETTQAVAHAIAIAETYGLGEAYYTHYREQVRTVSAADVRRAAESHLHPEALLVLAAGDAQAIRGLLEQLGIGPLDVRDAADETAGVGRST